MPTGEFSPQQQAPYLQITHDIMAANGYPQRWDANRTVEIAGSETAPERESDGDLLARMGTDAVRWAAEFNSRFQEHEGYKLDEGWLIGWFANAIEAGRSAGTTERVSNPEDSALIEELETKLDTSESDYAALGQEWSALRRLLGEAEGTIVERTQIISNLRQGLAVRTRELEAAVAGRDGQERENESLVEALDELEGRNRDLTEELGVAYAELERWDSVDWHDSSGRL